MKTSQRHQLKTNEVAETVARVRQTFEAHQRNLTVGVVALAVVVAAVGGFLVWRSQRLAAAGTALAEAMAVATSPIVPPPTPAPGQTPMPQLPGSYASEEARSKAALDKYLVVANKYGSADAGITARYQAAALLSELGRFAEAEKEFTTVMDQAGSSVYGRTARLGLAEAQVRAGHYDQAIGTYRELAARTDGDLPIDGLLMQLARTYALAGKKAEALQTYRRIVDEFPQSLYASDARREVESLKAPGSQS